MDGLETLRVGLRISMLNRFSSVSYFRNFIFGVEDSLVSTVGLLSGASVVKDGFRISLVGGAAIVIGMLAGSLLSKL